MWVMVKYEGIVLYLLHNVPNTTNNKVKKIREQNKQSLTPEMKTISLCQSWWWIERLFLPEFFSDMILSVRKNVNNKYWSGWR